MKTRNIGKAMQTTLDNARQFLADSRLLAETGSTGHAVSLAILGYEEAHKAYLLSYFLSVFDGIKSEKMRAELKSQLLYHSWKQIYAKEFRTGLEGLIKSGEITNGLITILGLPTDSELKEGSDIVFSKNINKLKNDGFYTNPFSDPVWNPLDVKKDTVKEIQLLLENHIKSIESTIEWLPLINQLPDAIVGPVKLEIREILDTISKAESEKVSIDELRKRLSKLGDVGKLGSELAKISVTDGRIKKIKQEKERKKRKKVKEKRKPK